MSEKGAMGWPTAVLRSLEINKFYGKVLSISHPTDLDPLLRVEFKVSPQFDSLDHSIRSTLAQISSLMSQSLLSLNLTALFLPPFPGSSCGTPLSLNRWKERAAMETDLSSTGWRRQNVRFIILSPLPHSCALQIPSLFGSTPSGVSSPTHSTCPGTPHQLSNRTSP
jgi:hypothetical protein